MQWDLSITCTELSACSQQTQPETQNVGCNMHSGTLSRQTACENAENIIARFILNTILKTVLLLTQDKLVMRTLRLFHTATFILNIILKIQFFFWLKTNWLWEHWDYFILQDSPWRHSSSDSRQTNTVLLIQDKLVVRRLRLFHIASFIVLKTQFFSW